MCCDHDYYRYFAFLASHTTGLSLDTRTRSALPIGTAEVISVQSNYHKVPWTSGHLKLARLIPSIKDARGGISC